jgi:hypothetical protein
MLALLLTGLPVSEAQSIPTRSSSISISTYRDDPFVAPSVVEQMSTARFGLDEDGRRVLIGNLVTISEESKIYRKDSQTGDLQPFAWNPWPKVATANQQGDFRFPNEARFPLHQTERDAAGKVILKDGLQVWTPRDLYLGDTTAFAAAHAAKAAAESWAGRDIRWGVNGVLDIEAHAFIDFNAYYSPSARSLFFAVVPYRLPGQTDVKVFETVTSWEMVAHECGHALLAALKPNVDHSDQGFRTWGESFGDQTAMWASLRNQDRVQRLLAETGGNLNQSNSLSSLIEAFAALVGKGTGVRDAFHDQKVSDTSEEVHDRSEVLTGAAYKLFLKIYDELKCEHSAEEALQKAGQIMGIFQVRAADYTPENQMTLEDVAKAYLKVDKEFFGSRYHAALVDEFTRREIFDANSEHEWQVHEDSVPYLYLSRQSSDQDIEEMLQANVDRLGLGQDFGLKLQSVIREEGRGQTIVRAQLTLGRWDGATLLNNHAVLVFRADGLLADYHAPLQPHASLQAGTLMQARETVQLRSLISQAKRLRLDQHGAPLSIVRKAGGQLTVESRVLRGEGLNTYLEVFTPDNPLGERREVMTPPVPPDKRIPIADDLLK